jgi:HD-GYP domain-containing protein (c-di-GMP phosphodiesterase class II)
MVARIMAVADVYDALVTDRPYRPGMAKEDAIAAMQREADEGLLDAAAVSWLECLVGRWDNDPKAS